MSLPRPPIALLLILLAGTPSAPPETITLVAGGGRGGEGARGAEAKLTSPFGLVATRAGTIVFVEMTGHRVREVDASGVVRTIAGTGREGFAGDGGSARDAEFRGMHSLALAPDGDLLIADTWNQRVRRIDKRTGAIQTIAGTGEKGFSGDGGPATAARFGAIYSIAVSPDGTTMALADLDNRRVRAVDLATGLVRTVAGNGLKGVPEDGAGAVDAPLLDPRAVALDGQGNLYILERGGHALRVVGRDGTIRTVVGTGKPGLSGDGGPGRLATLNGPKDLAIDRDGGVLIADTENHCIRKFRPDDGTILRVAGTGEKGESGLGGGPTEARLAQPHGVAVDGSGALLISDSSNHRIVRIVRP